MSAVVHVDLKEARVRLSEAREQADLVEKLLREGKSTSAAKDLLDSMQTTLDELRWHVDAVSEAAL